jgi:uncharacterized membrane protein YdjX (TVP38/TMEM64 family)
MRGYFKAFMFGIWMLMVSLAIFSFVRSGLSLNEIITKFQETIKGYGTWGPIIYVLFYSFRSLIFFPASILTAASGLLFGPVNGILLTIIGENISANISFLVGRHFGSGIRKHLGSRNRVLPFFERKYQENGFLAVLTMRLMYLPFDLIGYMSGVFDIRQKDFALGTFFGTIPGLATFVLIGSALTDYRNFILALVFFVIGWTISRCLKEREKVSKILSTSG